MQNFLIAKFHLFEVLSAVVIKLAFYLDWLVHFCSCVTLLIAISDVWKDGSQNLPL
jgi:hypothetical protein